MNRTPYGNREYENWNGSRWDFTKRRSEWHFDPMRPPMPGKDSYTYVGRFASDYTNEIQQCLPRTTASTWATRNTFDKGPEDKKTRMYSADAEERDLLRVGANPYMEIFDRAVADTCPKFVRIAEILGIDTPSIKFHNQRTGQMLVEHLDNFAGRPERGNSFKVTEIDKHPDNFRRFVIMLDDWKLGQVFMLGNACWTQWRAGDCITWDWKDIPHATCNMGWEDRPMLQVTGYVTDTTRSILANAGTQQIYNV